MSIFKSEATVSSTEIGELLGLSTKTISALATAGVLVRSGRGRYQLKKSIKGYCDHLRKSASGRGSPTATERVRLVAAQADAAEHKAKALANSLLPAADVEAGWAGIVRAIRAALLALPSRVGAQVSHLTPHDIVVIDDEVKAVLQELSTTEVQNEE
jgi:phage terminase Nu1 subunit (DNA packaging protein)